MTPFTSSQQLLASGPPACIKTGAKVKRNPPCLQIARASTYGVLAEAPIFSACETRTDPGFHTALYSLRSSRRQSHAGSSRNALGLCPRCSSGERCQASSK